MRYVYVGDQGRVFGSADDPTDEDFAYAAVGMVIIIRIADGHYFGRDHEWRPIPPGRLGIVEVNGESNRPFHYHATDF